MGTIDCACGKSIPARPEWAGKKIRCPQCHAILPVPADPAAEPAPLPAPPPAPDEPPQTRPCPFCGEAIQAAARKCRFCGELLDGSSHAPFREPAAAPAIDGGGVGILVLAILGWVVPCFGVLLAPLAWAMGQSYERDCRRRGVEPSGAGKAGRILGIVGTVFVGIGFLFFGFFLVLALVSGG